MVEQLGAKCNNCGVQDSCYDIYDFHHLDPNKKDFAIAKNITYNYKKILEEIKKCILICSNCHRKVHAGSRKYNYKKGTSMGIGTLRRYKNEIPEIPQVVVEEKSLYDKAKEEILAELEAQNIEVVSDATSKEKEEEKVEKEKMVVLKEVGSQLSTELPKLKPGRKPKKLEIALPEKL